jgi:hypothetical protein
MSCTDTALIIPRVPLMPFPAPPSTPSLPTMHLGSHQCYSADLVGRRERGLRGTGTNLAMGCDCRRLGALHQRGGRRGRTGTARVEGGIAVGGSNRPVSQPSRWGSRSTSRRSTVPRWSSNLLAAGTLTLLGGCWPPRVGASWHVGCRRRGHTAPYSGRGASSPNRNDNRTKRRPAVTSRTSCRCEQLNSSAAPAAGRYSSGPYSGKRS